MRDPAVLNIISHQNTLYGIERTGSSNSGVGRVLSLIWMAKIITI